MATRGRRVAAAERPVGRRGCSLPAGRPGRGGGTPLLRRRDGAVRIRPDRCAVASPRWQRGKAAAAADRPQMMRRAPSAGERLSAAVADDAVLQRRPTEKPGGHRHPRGGLSAPLSATVRRCPVSTGSMSHDGLRNRQRLRETEHRTLLRTAAGIFILGWACRSRPLGAGAVGRVVCLGGSHGLTCRLGVHLYGRLAGRLAADGRAARPTNLLRSHLASSIKRVVTTARAAPSISAAHRRLRPRCHGHLSPGSAARHAPPACSTGSALGPAAAASESLSPAVASERVSQPSSGERAGFSVARRTPEPARSRDRTERTSLTPAALSDGRRENPVTTDQEGPIEMGRRGPSQRGPGQRG